MLKGSRRLWMKKGLKSIPQQAKDFSDIRGSDKEVPHFSKGMLKAKTFKDLHMDFDHSDSDDDGGANENTLSKAGTDAGREINGGISLLKEHWQWTKHQQLWRRLFRGIAGQGRWKTRGCCQRGEIWKSKKQENSQIMIVVIFRIVWQLSRCGMIQCNKENKYSLDCNAEKNTLLRKHNVC